ncbi:hypothetical protein JCM5350_005470 [Sporobolomyces pararoseus]
MTADHGKRKSSTKGRHIKQINPLAKGKSCLTCRQRKVRCTAERPACQACLRTARFEGRDLSTVQCAYNDNPTLRGRRGQRRETKEPAEGITTTEASGSDQSAAKGTMSDLLNGTSYSEAAGGTSYAPLPSTTSFLQQSSQANPVSNVPWNAWSSTNATTSAATTEDAILPPFSTTPPLIHSTASSPTETTFSCPPTPTASPAPTSIVQTVSSNPAYVPYFHQQPSISSHNAYYSNPSSTLPYPYPYATAPDYSNNFIPMRNSTNDPSKFPSYQQQPQYSTHPSIPWSNPHPYASSVYPPPPPPQQFSPSSFSLSQEKSTSGHLSTFSLSSLPSPHYSTYLANSSLPSLNLPRLENVAPQSTSSHPYPLMPQNR